MESSDDVANIHQLQLSINGHLATIKKNLGFHLLTLDVDYSTFDKYISAKIHKHQPGSGVNEYLESLARNTANEDIVVSEILADTVGESAVLQFVYLPEGIEPSTIVFEENIVKVIHTPGGIGENVEDFGKNIQDAAEQLLSSCCGCS